MFFRNKNTIKKRKLKVASSQPAAFSRQTMKRGSGRIFSKILSFFLLFIFFGVTVYLLFFSPFLIISKIKVAGTKHIDSGLIQEAVSVSISGKYLNAVSRGNIILASKAGLERALKSRFKRIKSVKISKKFPDTITAAVEERESLLVLCGAGNCFVVDGGGVAYAMADFQSSELGEDELVVLHDDGNKEMNLSEKVFDPGRARYLSDIREKLKSDAGIDIDRNYHTPQLISGDIRVATAQGWQIFFDENIPVQKEVDMLKLVLDEKVAPNKTSDLEYVDLRTDNKVYYKFKNSEQPQQEDSSGDIEKDKKSKDSSKPKST